MPESTYSQRKGEGWKVSNPPALEQHVKRAVSQGGYVWGQATALKPVLPEPTNWGWTSGGEKQLQPQWVTLPAAGVSCKELVHCGCKKS